MIDADMKSYQEEESVMEISINQSLNFCFQTLLSSLFYDCQEEEGEGDIKYGWMPFDGDFQFASM
jgi:hypothetical protein